MQSFLYISKSVEFHETVGLLEKFALVSATFLELGKASINGRIYRFSEANQIASSMIGAPVYFGVDWRGKHKLNEAPVGEVVDARVFPKTRKIKGIIKVTNRSVIEKLKNGFKFLFSVGGVAQKERFLGKVNKAGKKVRELIGTVVQHLQLIPSGKNIFGQSKVGFESAKMERVLEIQESAMYVGKSIALLTSLGLI